MTSAWSAMNTSPSRSAGGPAPAIRCRTLRPDDRDALAALLREGFPTRTVAYWQQALDRLFAHTAAGPFPQSGFLLEAEGRPLGVILTVYAAHRSEPGRLVCNLSSWFVREEVGPFATMLVSRVLRDPAVTYINISPERRTRPMIEAQGFSAYTGGTQIALPLMSAGRERVSWRRLEAGDDLGPLPPAERNLVSQHIGYGCLVYLCRTADGEAHPFVLFPRPALKGVLPAAQLGYCRSLESVARCAAALGRALLRRGILALTVDALEKVPGLTGPFLPDRSLRFARGPHPPRIGDLAFTEAALFGL